MAKRTFNKPWTAEQYCKAMGEARKEAAALRKQRDRLLAGAREALSHQEEGFGLGCCLAPIRDAVAFCEKKEGAS